jgi:hypothetical protein
VRVARERGVLDRMRHHTEADIYLWVMRHRQDLEQQLGQDVGPIASATDYAEIVVPAASPLSRLAERARRLLGEKSRRQPRSIHPDPIPGVKRPEVLPVDGGGTAAE